jgi:hypothetical protein
VAPRGRRIERDRSRVYAYRPAGSPSDVDGAGSHLVARDVYRKGTRGRTVAFHDEVERMSPARGVGSPWLGFRGRLAFRVLALGVPIATILLKSRCCIHRRYLWYPPP